MLGGYRDLKCLNQFLTTKCYSNSGDHLIHSILTRVLLSRHQLRRVSNNVRIN